VSSSQILTYLYPDFKGICISTIDPVSPTSCIPIVVVFCGFSFVVASPRVWTSRLFGRFASAASPIPHTREKEEKRGREVPREREKRREKEEEEKRKANIMAVKNYATILIIASAIVLMSHNLVQ
jgi:hypothetical protein